MPWFVLALMACDGTDSDSDVEPVVEGLRIAPSPLRHGDVPRCVLGSQDVVGEWSVNGVSVGSSATLEAVLWPGDQVRCETASESADAAVQGGNILVIVSDDQGVDWMGAYGEGDARTPNLDSLADEGLLFRRAYAQPVCSPTRAALLTGRWAFRTGIGQITITEVTPPTELPDAEITVAEHLAAHVPEYENRLLGKWHLGEGPLSGWDQPNQQGFDYYAGTFVGIWSYWQFQKTTNGESELLENVYITTDTTEDALEAMATMPEPWLLLVNYNAPHEPLDLPPPALHSYDLDADSTLMERMAGVVEAMDTEIGRLLEAVEPIENHTTVMFLSDNGTPNHLMVDRETGYGGKSSVRETGGRVPFVVKGPVVREPGTETFAKVHVIDLLPTIADLAGAPPPDSIDGLSLRPVLDGDADELHTHMLIERFAPNGPGPYELHHRGLRGPRFKIIELGAGNRALYDMGEDEREGEPVPMPYTGDAALAFDELSALLDTAFVP